MAARRGSVLIAAVSGRALARAARHAGLVPLVADFFADTDTMNLAHAVKKLDGIADGFQWASPQDALVALESQAPSPVLGVICGSGFEDRTDLLTRIAERWPLLGNDAQTVAWLNDPERFFALLDELAIPHPETRLERPSDIDQWVAKRIGGAGGSHVRPAPLYDHCSEVYYQRLVRGRTMSALFVGNGEHARVLGFSEQWTAPAPEKPWRFGGAARPAQLPDATRDAMESAATRLARACALKGLGSADFVLDGEVPLLLEINPRPGGTLDIFAHEARPLLALHLDAVMDAALPDGPLAFDDAAASAILFAPEAITIPHGVSWPEWAADIPKPGEHIDKQRPICTVLTTAGTAESARQTVQIRQGRLLAELRDTAHTQRSQKEDSENCEEKNETAEPQHAGRAAGR